MSRCSGHASYDGRVEVDAAHLRHNVDEIQRLVAPRPVIAVIKANAYGGGLVEIARTLEPLPAIRQLAVGKMQEAVVLRDAGIRKPILLLGPSDERDLDEAANRGIQPMVHTPIGDTLDKIASQLQRPVPIQICIDTGLGRLGFQSWRALPAIRDLVGRTSVLSRGVMTHLVKQPEVNRRQLERLDTLSRQLVERGLRPGPRHAASSEDLFQGREYFLDLVRVGLCLFGIYPTSVHRAQGTLDLKPAIRFRCRVASVKELRPGDAAGYREAYVATRRVWIATLPVGHSDGLPRAAVRGARVKIAGRLYPLIGMIFANHCMVEIGEERTVEIGDDATFFDAQEGSRPEDVAAACGISVYDLIMHLNPLMPRRLIDPRAEVGSPVVERRAPAPFR